MPNKCPVFLSPEVSEPGLQESRVMLLVPITVVVKRYLWMDVLCSLLEFLHIYKSLNP